MSSNQFKNLLQDLNNAINALPTALTDSSHNSEFDHILRAPSASYSAIDKVLTATWISSNDIDLRPNQSNTVFLGKIERCFRKVGVDGLERWASNSSLKKGQRLKPKQWLEGLIAAVEELVETQYSPAPSSSKPTLPIISLPTATPQFPRFDAPSPSIKSQFVTPSIGYSRQATYSPSLRAPSVDFNPPLSQCQTPHPACTSSQVSNYNHQEDRFDDDEIFMAESTTSSRSSTPATSSMPPPPIPAPKAQKLTNVQRKVIVPPERQSAKQLPPHLQAQYNARKSPSPASSTSPAPSRSTSPAVFAPANAPVFVRRPAATTTPVNQLREEAESESESEDMDDDGEMEDQDQYPKETGRFKLNLPMVNAWAGREHQRPTIHQVGKVVMVDYDDYGPWPAVTMNRNIEGQWMEEAGKIEGVKEKDSYLVKGLPNGAYFRWTRKDELAPIPEPGFEMPTHQKNGNLLTKNDLCYLQRAFWYARNWKNADFSKFATEEQLIEKEDRENWEKEKPLWDRTARKLEEGAKEDELLKRHEARVRNRKRYTRTRWHGLRDSSTRTDGCGSWDSMDCDEEEEERCPPHQLVV
ncbi:hypothetical protein T439DRAFT_329079 [Meredithblackwellia eburnea MCA 4105]